MSCRSAAAILGVVLAGCSSSGSHPTVTVDAGTSAVGRSCSVDAECAPLPCDPIRLQCICQSDSDCPGQFCDNFTGLCVASVPGCTSATNCGAGNFCNPATRACEALKGFCQTCNPLATPTDPACGAGNSCHADTSLDESFCTIACTGNAGCPTGSTCQDINLNSLTQCWPAPGSNCKTFTGCVPDQLTSCNTPDDCVIDGGYGGQACDSTRGLCIALEQVCPLGTTCDSTDRVCVGSCTVDEDCVPPDQCVNSICQPVPGCQNDTDCPANKVCNIANNAASGQCVPFCTADTDCPTGEICLPTLEADGTTREKCKPLCFDSTECPLNQVCVDSNQNLLHGSADGGDFGSCSSTVAGQAACQITPACSTCQYCGNDNTCQSATSYGFCASCDPSAQVPCQNGATCTSLAGLDGDGMIIASGPYFCGIPCQTATATVPDIDGAECPAGFVCVALETNLGYICVPTNFDCTQSPLGGPVCP